MRFKTKMVSLSILISIAVIAVIIVSVTQGIYNYTIQNDLDSLSLTANEVTMTIIKTIKSSQTTQQSEQFYKETANYFTEEITAVYALQVILYDNEGNLLSSSSPETTETDYTQHVLNAYENRTSGYIYTKISGVNYLVFFSPVIINNVPVGVCALLSPTAKIDSMVSRTSVLFAVVSAVLAVSAAFAYSFSYNKMLSPIINVAEYMRQIPENGKLSLPDIKYSGNDEIKDLLDGCSVMVEKINANFDERTFEKEKLMSVISSMQDAVIAINLNDESVTTNEKFSEYFPSDADYFAILPHIDNAVSKTKQSGENKLSEFAYADKSFLMSTSTISNPGAEDGVLLVIKDITSVRRIEEQQQKFISSVSHELRTPLTTITGYIDLLQRRGTDDKELTEKALETTKKETQRLLRLVNDLLNITKYNTTDFEFIFSDISPDDLISEAVNEMNLKAEERKVFVLYSRTDLPVIVGDRDRLKQVLINIIDNAVKYSNPEDAVRVVATYDSESLEITVRDFGAGIPEDKRDRVFDTFYRVEEDRNRLRGGFGLGLSVVKNIIKRHSGTVTVESIEDQGTLFTIKLPLPSKNEEAKTSEAAAETEKEAVQ